MNTPFRFFLKSSSQWEPLSWHRFHSWTSRRLRKYIRTRPPGGKLRDAFPDPFGRQDEQQQNL